MMTDTTEMGGALYLIPGSHKLGRIEPVYDESTSAKFWFGGGLSSACAAIKMPFGSAPCSHQNLV